jgi:hypothetical protein
MPVDDAKILVTVLSAVVIPFAVTWLKAVTWPDTYKFAVAVLLSLVAGGLTAYVAGQIVLSGSLVQNASVIFTAAQLVYYGAFRALGLEKVLFPQSALAHAAEEQASAQVSNVSSAQARDILDPNTSPSLDVTTNVVNEPTV